MANVPGKSYLHSQQKVQRKQQTGKYNENKNGTISPVTSKKVLNAVITSTERKWRLELSRAAGGEGIDMISLN